MRRIRIAGLALALVVGTASAAFAQRGGRGPGDPIGPLLHGITLTETQQKQLQALREEHRPDSLDARARRAGPDSATRARLADARQRGDTAELRRIREQAIASGQFPPPRGGRGRMQGDSAQAGRRMPPRGGPEMAAQRAEMIADVRALLTAAQQKQFDANLAELQKRMRERR